MKDYEQKAFDQRTRVDEILEGAGVKYSVVNRGVRTVKPEKDKCDCSTSYAPAPKPYEQDAWEVTFAKRQKDYHGPHNLAEMHTPFYTGLGHRMLPIAGNSFAVFRKNKEGKSITSPEAPLGYDRDVQMRNAKPVAPRAADVLYCLLSDSDAMHMSFHDWASDFGYDTDSLKALNTYNKCCEIGRELRTVFTSEQLKELQTALEDF